MTLSDAYDELCDFIDSCEEETLAEIYAYVYGCDAKYNEVTNEIDVRY